MPWIYGYFKFNVVFMVLHAASSIIAFKFKFF